MNIEFGIIAAMGAECEALKAVMTYTKEHQYGQMCFFEGMLHGRKIILNQCGIGKVAAAVGTSLLIEKFAPKYIVNTGSAGGFAADLNIGDIIVSEKMAYHDVDLTSFDHYVIGQMAGCKPEFYADAHLLQTAENIAPSDNRVRLRKGFIVSGDSFISATEQQQKIQQNFPTADVIEMEAAAIAHTCMLFNTPFIAIRSVSDLINHQGNHIDFHEFLPIAAKNSLDIVTQILQNHPKKG